MKPVPKPITVITGDQHTVQKTIDDFFYDMGEFVKKRYSGPSDFQIKSEEIVRGPDRRTYMVYNGKIILASVLETRTEFNNVRYTFSRHFNPRSRNLE